MADAVVAQADEADVEALRESIAAVLAEECTSLALHAHIDGEADLAGLLGNQARALGWMTIGLPEALGGFGLGVRGLALLNTELGRVAAPGAFLATSAAAQVLADEGREAARNWLSRLAQGEAWAAIPAALDRCLVQTSGGRLSGRIALLGSIDAAIALIPAGDGELALIDLTQAQCTPLNMWDRTRPVMEVLLEGVSPVGWIGDDGAGTRALSRAFAIGVAADSIGLARGIAEKTIAYMKERVQFGRPIGSFQALKHRAVDLVARIGIAEHVLAQAVEVAQGRDLTADMWAKLAKAAASEAGCFVAGDCVQLHGGVGFTWEFDVHIFLKRARLNEMLVGNNLILRDRAAAELATVTAPGASTLELPAL